MASFAAGHKLPQTVMATPDEFLQNFRFKTSEYLSNAYLADFPLRRLEADGRLITSQGSQIFAMFKMLMDIVQEYLDAGKLTNSDAGDAIIIDVLNFLLLSFRYKQTHFRDRCLRDLEGCCASANDCLAMVEVVEEVMDDVMERRCPLRKELREGAIMMINERTRDLATLYGADAVYSAQMVQHYVFAPICDKIEEDLFTDRWEANLTQNELARSIVRTVEDFMGDIEVYIGEDFLLKKAVDALVTATVVFYVRCLLVKARRRHQWSLSWSDESTFVDPQRAVLRMRDDIEIMKDYFVSLVPKMPALARVIEKEFAMLTAIFECLSIGSGLAKSGELADFVLVFHKCTRQVSLTRAMVGDIYHLVAPGKEHMAKTIVDSMQENLEQFPDINRSADAQEGADRLQVPGLRMDLMLYETYNIDGLGKHLHRLSSSRLIEHLRSSGIHHTRTRPTEEAHVSVEETIANLTTYLQDLRAMAEGRRAEI